MSSKTQEQMTDIIEDDINQKQSSTIKENSKKKTLIFHFCSFRNTV